MAEETKRRRDPWDDVLKRRVKALRQEARLSQVQAAKLLRKPQSFVSKCESGERRVMGCDLPRFARAYRAPIDSFFRADLVPGIVIPEEFAVGQALLAAERPGGASLPDDKPRPRRRTKRSHKVEPRRKAAAGNRKATRRSGESGKARKRTAN